METVEKMAKAGHDESTSPKYSAGGGAFCPMPCAWRSWPRSAAPPPSSSLPTPLCCAPSLSTAPRAEAQVSARPALRPQDRRLRPDQSPTPAPTPPASRPPPCWRATITSSTAPNCFITNGNVCITFVVFRHDRQVQGQPRHLRLHRGKSFGFSTACKHEEEDGHPQQLLHLHDLIFGSSSPRNLLGKEGQRASRSP